MQSASNPPTLINLSKLAQTYETFDEFDLKLKEQGVEMFDYFVWFVWLSFSKLQCFVFNNASVCCGCVMMFCGLFILYAYS